MKQALAAAIAAAALVGTVGAMAEGGVEPNGDRLTSRNSTLANVRGLALPGGSARAAATWCGTASQADRSPNTLAGNPVHWVYAILFDGQDRLSSIASVMQTDAEAIDAWWRTQDMSRLPRNDLTQFSCGLQLDVTTVRLPQSSSVLAPLNGRFAAVFDALNAADLRSPFTKYLVYYDGAVSDANVCGQGGK